MGREWGRSYLPGEGTDYKNEESQDEKEHKKGNKTSTQTENEQEHNVHVLLQSCSCLFPILDPSRSFPSDLLAVFQVFERGPEALPSIREEKQEVHNRRK